MLKIENRYGLNLMRFDELNELYGIKNYKIKEFEEVMKRYPEVCTYGVLSSSYSQSSLIVASLCKKYNKKAIVYYMKRTKIIEDAENMGAETIKLNVTRLAIGTGVAKKMFGDKGAFISTGTNNNEEIYKTVSADAKKYLKDLNNKRIHINVGSGMTFFSLLTGLITIGVYPKFSVYETAMEVKYSKYSITNYFDITKYKMPYKYEEEIVFDEFNKIYDAKMFKYMFDNKTYENGDYVVVIGSE